MFTAGSIMLDCFNSSKTQFFNSTGVNLIGYKTNDKQRHASFRSPRSYFENLDDLSNNPLKQAIDYASNLGVLVVTAAGNSSADSSFAFPASSPETITVAAANPDSSIASFSNYGSSVDVLAPGVDIV